MAKSLYIIDGHAHIYAGYYAPMRANLVSPTGEPTKATYIFTNTLLGLIQKYSPDMLVVTMDSKTKSFRSDIYPEYKAHRPPMPEDMPSQIKRIEQILEAMNIPMLRLDGYEADDIIGTLATKASQNGDNAYICSRDKDMLQLLDERVNIFDVKTGDITSVDTLKEDKGITPQQFIDVLSLMGDTADNIPGLPDVGPKTALTWIQKYGSIDGLYENADDIKGKRGDSLRNNKDNAYLSKKLVIIDRDSPVEYDTEQFAIKPNDTEKLTGIFKELGFNKLLAAIGVDVPAAKSEKSVPAGQSLFDMSSTMPAGMDNIKNTDHEYILVDDEEKFENFYAKLKQQKIFAFDTETTSIFAMKASLVGMSFSWQSHTGYYIPVAAPLGAKTLSVKFLREKLNPILADKDIKKIGQNIKYDLLIMSSAGFDVQGVYFDTMVASYVLATARRSHSMDNMAKDFLNYEPVPISDLIGKGKKQQTFDIVDTAIAAEYAAEDADITWQLYEYFSARLDNDANLKKLFTEIEMPLVTVLTDMERNGVSIDTTLLRSMSKDINEEMDKLTDKIFAFAGCPFNIDSPKQLAEILFDKLNLETVKKGKASRSTDASVLDQLFDQHEIVPLVLQYRQLAKLRNTYVDKLGTLINSRTSRVHASFNQTITVTGRLSSSDPNLQNIPIRTELGRKIRSAFVPAQKGYVILSADYSQIELRLLAHFSGDQALKNAFANDIDIHTFVASQIFDTPVEEVTSEMRSHSKAVNFGIIYGQGPHGLARTTGMTYAQAKDFINDYFKKYGSIKDFMNATIERAKSTGYAETISGRRRTINSLDSKNFNLRSQSERYVINTTIQGSAADLIKIAMINIQNQIVANEMSAKMLLQIHDELVFELPEKDAQQFSIWLADKMENAMTLDVPLKVSIGYGPNWLEGK